MSEAGTDTAGRGRRFILQKRIGEGAFGEVYLAEQDSGAGFRRRVALKVLHPEVARSKKAAKRMRDEARILGRLAHRHIVSVLDLVAIDDRWVIVMDYVEGADLEHVVQALHQVGKPFPIPAALYACACVARALDAAFHADDGAGAQLCVVHRDIKPSNVRLTRDGDVKVLDFGVARVELNDREAQTKAGAFIGTERYMSPERLLTRPSGPPGDVYALAATLVELLLLRPLGKSPVLPDEHAPFVDETLESVRVRLGERPATETVIALLRSALHADPAERPDPATFGSSLAALARRFEGDDLETFTRRFVPEVQRLIGPMGETVVGSLTENTTGRGSSEREHPLAAGTFLPDPDEAGQDALPPTAVSTATSARSVEQGRAVLWGVALGVALVVVVLGVGVVWMVGWRAPSPASEPAILPAMNVPSPPPEAIPADEVPVDAAMRAAEADPAPAPEPAPDAVPEPEPAATPAPARAAARPPPKPPAAEPEPEPEPAPAVAPDAPRVSRAQVSVTDASALTVRCGDVTVRGTASVRIRDFPAGSCTITATWLGQQLSTHVAVDRPRAVVCAAGDGGLTCDG